MRSIELAVILAAVCATASAQSGASDPQQLLVTAEQQADLFHRAKEPFVLEADVSAQMKDQAQGQILIHWGSKDKWRREIKLGAFAMVKTSSGENTLTLRNVAFTPPRVEELVGLLGFAESEKDISALELKQRHEGGAVVVCIDFEIVNRGNQKRRACIDPATNDITSETWDAGGGRRREEFSDYVDFDGGRYPRQIRLLVNGDVVLTVHVTRLATEPFDDKLLTLPEQAIARRECEGETPPTAATPPPAFDIGSLPGIQGSLSMTVTILEDGSVGDVQITSGGLTQRANDGVVKAVKKAKFKPAMCGSEAVAADITITMSFRRD